MWRLRSTMASEQASIWAWLTLSRKKFHERQPILRGWQAEKGVISAGSEVGGSHLLRQGERRGCDEVEEARETQQGEGYEAHGGVLPSPLSMVVATSASIAAHSSRTSSGKRLIMPAAQGSQPAPALPGAAPALRLDSRTQDLRSMCPGCSAYLALLPEAGEVRTATASRGA